MAQGMEFMGTVSAEVSLAGPGERVSIYLNTEVVASVNGVEIDPSDGCAVEVAERSALPHIPRHQSGRVVAVYSNCPQCGGQDLRIVIYDCGTCSQTGYRDAGERWECRTCGANGDGEELDTQRKGRIPSAPPRCDRGGNLRSGDEEAELPNSKN